MLVCTECGRQGVRRGTDRCILCNEVQVELPCGLGRERLKPWEKEERRLARRRGGTRTGGSGSGWKRRNDVREDGILWEQKTTGKRQFTIKEDDWENLRKNALIDGRIPSAAHHPWLQEAAPDPDRGG